MTRSAWTAPSPKTARRSPPVPFLPQLQSAFGLLALIGLAFAISEDRRAVRPRTVALALALTVALALLLLKVPGVTAAFSGIAAGVDAVAAAT
ncbi:hypothetical protein CH338_25485, partial [Rhodoplanes elegans]